MGILNFRLHDLTTVRIIYLFSVSISSSSPPSWNTAKYILIDVPFPWWKYLFGLSSGCIATDSPLQFSLFFYVFTFCFTLLCGRLVGVFYWLLTEWLVVFLPISILTLFIFFWLTDISSLSFTNLVFPKGKSVNL